MRAGVSMSVIIINAMFEMAHTSEVLLETTAAQTELHTSTHCCVKWFAYKRTQGASHYTACRKRRNEKAQVGRFDLRSCSAFNLMSGQAATIWDKLCGIVSHCNMI